MQSSRDLPPQPRCRDLEGRGLEQVQPAREEATADCTTTDCSEVQATSLRRLFRPDQLVKPQREQRHPNVREAALHLARPGLVRADEAAERGMSDGFDAVLGPVRLCRRCVEWWPLDTEFYDRNNRTTSGFLQTCRACRSEGPGPRRSPDEQRRWERERHARYFANHPEALARRRELARARYWANPELARERQRERDLKRKAAA